LSDLENYLDAIGDQNGRLEENLVMEMPFEAGMPPFKKPYGKCWIFIKGRRTFSGASWDTDCAVEFWRFGSAFPSAPERGFAVSIPADFRRRLFTRT